MDEDGEKVVEELVELIDEITCDTDRFSQEDSAEIYERVAEHCRMWAATIRSEMTT